MAGPLNLLGSFMDPLNQDIGAGKLINCRVVRRGLFVEGKPGFARLVGSPGLTLVSSPSIFSCIALCHALGNIWSAHADGSIYYGVETANPVFAGKVTVNPAYPVIRLAEDRTALCIASNGTANGGTGSGYTATQSGGVVWTGFQNSNNIQFDPSAVCELDNATIWAGASNTYANQSAKMYSSVQLAPANVNANAFSTKEARADAVLDVVTTGRNFWPMGSRSIEQYYDSGSGADFPFVPYTNSFIEVGLAARLTLAVLHSKIMWVGTDRRVWLGQNQAAQAVSPAWVDMALQQVDLTQLTAYMYSQGGDEFYVLTLNGSWTLEYAVADGSWCYRQSNGRSDHVGRCAVEHDGGITYVGLATGQVCKLDMTAAGEAGAVMTRVILTPWIGKLETRNTINAVTMASYLGPAAGTFQFDWSEDGFGGVPRGVRQIAFPAPGIKRAVARNLGTSRRRQLRFTYQGNGAPFGFDELFADVSEEF